MFNTRFRLVVALVLLASGHLSLGDDDTHKKQIKLEDCGKNKGCYRTPHGCKNEEDCEAILTWQVKNDSVHFEVSMNLTSTDKWTAVGFSYDKMMGNDSVVDCIYDEKNQSIIIQSSFNTMDPNNVVLSHNQLGIMPGKSSGAYTNHRIMCSFSRMISVTNDPEASKVFNMNANYYIFLPKGPAMNGVKQVHTTPPIIVPMMINTTSPMYKDFNNIGLSGCGKDKGCYRVPSNCTGEEDCTHMLTWEVKDNMVNFGISSLLTAGQKWTAVAFSYDKLMGNDSVVDCIYNDTDQTMIIQSSYNTPTPDNQVLTNKQLGIVPGNSMSAYIDGRMVCTFSHYIAVPGNSSENTKVFNLNGTYYLFLGRGIATKGVKQVHTETPSISPKAVNVSDKHYMNIGGDTFKSALAKTHGSLMIIAWMLITSVAVMLPKYFKSSGAQSGLCGKALWFQVHRIMMIVSFILTCTAFIVIFVDVGGYTHRLSGIDAVHPIIGIVVTCLVVLNPIVGLLRPAIDSPNRPVFYAAHKTLGTFAHILAAAAMFLGTRLVKSNMPYYSQWVVVGFAVWHLAVDHLLQSHQKGYQKAQMAISDGEHDAEDTADTKPLAANNGLIAMKTTGAVKSATAFKTAVMVTHCCILLACSLILIINLAEN